MIDLIRRLFRGSETLHECRHCGTAVEADVEACPACLHDGIAVYRLD